MRKRLIPFAVALDEALGTNTAADYVAQIVSDPDIKLAIDIGCGITSLLTVHRPRLMTVGIDIFTIESAKDLHAHDHYISADITNIPVERIHEELFSVFGRDKVDLVTMFGVIEHFPKRAGFEMLDKIESLTDRYILIDTPNGFVPQGPEYGNPFQRHLSGWFPHEFEGYGYSVYGSRGTRYMRGYMGEPRIKLPGMRLLDDIVLSRILMTRHFPERAFNICAIKDVRGVPARYSSYDDPTRI